MTINGVDLPATGGTLQFAPNEEVEIRVILKQGYMLDSMIDGVTIMANGVQSGLDDISCITNGHKMEMPSQNWLAKDHELYLYFITTGIPEYIIGEVALNVPSVLCGEGYKVTSDGCLPIPGVTLPEDSPCELTEVTWLVKDSDGFTYPDEDHVFKGGETAYIGVSVVAKDPSVKDFSDDVVPVITITEGVSVISFGWEDDEMWMVLELKVRHIPGDPAEANRVEPTCTEKGHYDEVVSCTKCETEISRETVEIDPLGHDWDEWTVTEPAQIGVAGKEQRICKRNASHVEERDVDPLVGFTVSFDANGHGTPPDAQLVESGKTASKPADLEAEGFVFGGWFTDKEGKTAFDFSTAITADTTLYAKWTEAEKPVPAKYTITYDLNGGKLDDKTGTVTVEVEDGTSIKLPKPSRSGYLFDYWEGSRYEAGASYTVKENHTFKAQWKPIDPNSPVTGDESSVPLWIALMSVSAIALVCVFVIAKKRSAKKQDQ